MEKKLKILFLVPSFPSLTETFIVNQIIDLINRGHEVNIFSVLRGTGLVHQQITDYDLIRKTTFSDVPINIVERISLFFRIFLNAKGTNRRKLLSTLNPFKYGIAAFTLSSFFKVAWLTSLRVEFDIVHAHFGFMYSYYFRGKECGFFSNASLVTTFHGYDMVPSDVDANKIKYKELFDNNILITTNNEYGRSLLHLIRRDYDNIFLLPVALDTAYYRPVSRKSNTEKNAITILFCGRLIKWKGPNRLIEIANILINDKDFYNINFIMVGDGPKEYKDELNEMINKYQLNDKVTLVGARKQDEVIQLLNEADIFIMPGITDVDGRAETQGLVIQEAQAMKVPVVATNAGGMKYGLKHGETGYIVNEADLDDFVEKVQDLITDTQKRIQFGIVAREFVERNFDSKIIGSTLEQLYYKIKQKDVL